MDHGLNGYEFEQTLGDSEGVLQSMGPQRVRYDLGTEQQHHLSPSSGQK